MMCGRGNELPQLVLRGLHGAGHQVVHEAAVEMIAILVELDDLHKSGTDALRDAAMHLTLDDGWVDAHPAVVHRDEPLHLHLSRALVYLDDADVGAERVG